MIIFVDVGYNYVIKKKKIIFSEAIYQTLGELRHINDRKEPRDLVGGETFALLGTMGFDVADAMTRSSKQIRPSNIQNHHYSSNSVSSSVNVDDDDDNSVSDVYPDVGKDFSRQHQQLMMTQQQKVNPFSIENILASSEDKSKLLVPPTSNSSSVSPYLQPVGFLVRAQLARSPDSCQSSDVSASDYSAPSSPERQYKESSVRHTESEASEDETELRLRLQEGEDRNVMVVPCSPPPQQINDLSNNLQRAANASSQQMNDLSNNLQRNAHPSVASTQRL